MGNDYCQYLIDKEHRDSCDEEMSNIHHLFISPRPAAQPLCRHSKRCFASLGEDSSTFQVCLFRIKWLSVRLVVASRRCGLELAGARNPKIADHQPEKPRACHSFVRMPLSSAQ